MVNFFKALCFILTTLSLPSLTMYAAGSYAGQKRPNGVLIFGVQWIVGAGLFGGAFLVARSFHRDGWTFAELFSMAWILGACFAAQVGLLEYLAKGKARGAAETNQV